MPDLLLELYSEEIPARMQAVAQENLRKLVTGKLVDAGLTYEGAKAFSTPRRLTLAVQGLLARAPDLREEKKGPRVGAPDGAIRGFLKSAGLKSVEQAKVQQDKKGDFYVALIERAGRPAAKVIAEIVPQVVRNFPWPKSMRWGAPQEHSDTDTLVTESGETIVTESGDKVVVDVWLKWVRPLHSIVCTFGPETEEPEIVRFEIGGIASGDVTHGHPVLAPGPIKVRRLDDYLQKLEKAKVVPDRERRKATILADAKNLALAQGLELVEDEGLLEENAGLVEWPVVLVGEFDRAYLDLPPEVIRATIRNNQKCFVLREATTSPLVGEVGAQRREGGRAVSRSNSTAGGPPPPTPPHKGEGSKLANKFVLVSNIEAKDGGAAIKAGIARVIRARLADAKFFWEQDRKIKLEERAKKLAGIVFHEKLGTQAERVERIARLARELAPIVKADPAKAERAARLSKADLVTDMVGEFPELQGLMGKYYALAEGEDASVARAIEEHYKPQGPNDRVPSDPVSIAVALADKLNTLVGFWAIDEEPTGSKDPYALRRAALGVTRVLLNNKIRMPLLAVAARARKNFSAAADLLSFFADRLKVHLREQGARHDLVDAVFALPGQDDLLMIVRRVEALGKFLDSDDGKNLLVGYRRAANILRDAEKKDGRSYIGAPDPRLLRDPIEQHLWNTIQSTVADARYHL